MVLVLLVAVLALTGIAAVGGRTRSGPPVRAMRLLVVAALTQILVAAVSPDSRAARVAALVLCALLVGLFLLGNLRVRGVPLVGLGLLLNTLVIATNGAMPVSVEAAARAGVPAGSLVLAEDPLREPSTSRTRLGVLGDGVPVALPWRPQVVSPGDVLVAAGVGLMLVAGRRSGPGRTPRRRQPPSRLDRSMILESDSTTRGSYS